MFCKNHEAFLGFFDEYKDINIYIIYEEFIKNYVF